MPLSYPVGILVRAKRFAAKSVRRLIVRMPFCVCSLFGLCHVMERIQAHLSRV